MPAKKSAPKKSKSFDEVLWETAPKLQGNVESSDWSGATETTRQGSPKGERGRAQQHGVAGFDYAHFCFAPVVLVNGPASAGSTSTKGEGEGIIKSYRTAGRADPAELQKTAAIAA